MADSTGVHETQAIKADQQNIDRQYLQSPDHFANDVEHSAAADHLYAGLSDLVAPGNGQICQSLKHQDHVVGNHRRSFRAERGVVYQFFIENVACGGIQCVPTLVISRTE